MSDSQSRATGPVSFFEVLTAITYPATLIILGLKASTCFSSVFIVFPVPTIACNRKDRETGLRKQTGKCRPQADFSQTGEKRKTLVTLYLFMSRFLKMT